jgi:hypothetical protein
MLFIKRQLYLKIRESKVEIKKLESYVLLADWAAARTQQDIKNDSIRTQHTSKNVSPDIHQK